MLHAADIWELLLIIWTYVLAVYPLLSGDRGRRLWYLRGYVMYYIILPLARVQSEVGIGVCRLLYPVTIMSA